MTNNIQNPTCSLSFGEAVKTCYSKYATFSGRARRSEYWWFCLYSFIVGIAAIIIDMMMGTYSKEFSLGILSGLFCLVNFLPGLSLAVRRLHDINRSGWWYLICFIPFVGSIVLLVFFCLDSTPGVNRFGASPKYSGGDGWA